MSAVPLSTVQQAPILASSAKKYGIPTWALIGVYGMETTFGSNVSTSSAGAEGAFQFIPGTAATYNYPLTNTPTPAQFAQQSDSAAHYLSDLIKQHGGNWDAALHAYSGGGYGQAEVVAKAKGNFNLLAALSSVKGSGVQGASTNPGQIVKNLAAPFSSVVDFLNSLWSPLRILKLVVGLAIGYFALRQLAGAAGSTA